MINQSNKFASSTPVAQKLQSEAEKHLPGGSTRGTAYFTPHPFWADHGEGHYLYDVDGNKYLDFMLNATSLILGHAHPSIVAALHAQATKGVAFSAPTESQTVLSEILHKRIPSIDLLRFTSSGTEATMNAIRAACAFTGKHKIGKIEGGYHGSHDKVSISVNPPLNQLDPSRYNPIPEFDGIPQNLLDNIVVLPFNDLDTSENIINSNKDDLSCIIMEPIVSNFGYLPAQQNYLQGIRNITQEYNILLIFDEVQSFRMSPGGAQQIMQIRPDLTALGKIIGGGLPVGAFGGRYEVMEQFDQNIDGFIPHSGTFNGNPMSMEAGKTTLEQLDVNTYERLNHLGSVVRKKLQSIFDELEMDASVTGTGSFFGLHFGVREIKDYRSKILADQKMSKAIFSGLLNKGILLQQSCAGSLSTITDESHIDALIESIRNVMQDITAEQFH